MLQFQTQPGACPQSRDSLTCNLTSPTPYLMHSLLNLFEPLWVLMMEGYQRKLLRSMFPPASSLVLLTPKLHGRRFQHDMTDLDDEHEFETNGTKLRGHQLGPQKDWQKTSLCNSLFVQSGMTVSTVHSKSEKKSSWTVRVYPAPSKIDIWSNTQYP